MDIELLALAALIYLIAGLVKGTIGIGLPTIVISLLSTVADPRWAMSITLLPILITNTWQFYRANTPKTEVLAYWPFMLMLVSLNYGVSQLSFHFDTEVIMLVLGVVVIVFAITNLMRRPPPLPPRWDRLTQFCAGSAAGIMGGLTTIWGPPIVMYLLSKRIGKEEFVAASGAILTVGSLPLLVSYGQSDYLDAAVLSTSFTVLVPALLGMWLGEQIRKRINTERFIKVLLTVFLLLGLNLVRRAIT